MHELQATRPIIYDEQKNNGEYLCWKRVDGGAWEHWRVKELSDRSVT